MYVCINLQKHVFNLHHLIVSSNVLHCLEMVKSYCLEKFLEYWNSSNRFEWEYVFWCPYVRPLSNIYCIEFTEGKDTVFSVSLLLKKWVNISYMALQLHKTKWKLIFLFLFKVERGEKYNLRIFLLLCSLFKCLQLLLKSKDSKNYYQVEYFQVVVIFIHIFLWKVLNF